MLIENGCFIMVPLACVTLLDSVGLQAAVQAVADMNRVALTTRQANSNCQMFGRITATYDRVLEKNQNDRESLGAGRL